MASFFSSATQAAHSVAVSLLSSAQVKAGPCGLKGNTHDGTSLGSTIPTAVPVKENDPEKTFTFEGISGKNLFVGVPGAFSGTCSAQIPGYIKNYAEFKDRGIKDIYVVGVNDVFTMKAWKEQLASSGTPIRFVADDKGAFIGALGMLFDASAMFGAPRSKRFVLITEGADITYVVVEPQPGQVTVTAADKVLPLL